MFLRATEALKTHETPMRIVTKLHYCLKKTNKQSIEKEAYKFKGKVLLRVKLGQKFVVLNFLHKENIN